MLDIKHDLQRKVVICTVRGVIRLEEMRSWLASYKQQTDVFANAPHILIADMRGMAPLAPEVAEVLGEAIGYGRAHGVVLCAHLSDSGTVRLQSRRVAREVDPHDRCTIDVVSLEEAWALIAEREATQLAS